MGDRKLNAEQRRLERVRALKEAHFPAEASLEEQLAEKDDRIAELEREVELLRLQLSRARPQPESGPTGDPTSMQSSES